MQDEEWRGIDWFPNYRISSYGRVWNIKRDYILKPSLSIGGYHKTALSANGKTYGFFVHRLVAEAFFGPEPHLDVNHIDGNKINNYVSNLEWVTHRQNMIHAHESDFIKSPGFPPIKVRIIELDREFRSISECARYLSCSTGPIAQCLAGKRSSYKGYQFEVVNSK